MTMTQQQLNESREEKLSAADYLERELDVARKTAEFVRRDRHFDRLTPAQRLEYEARFERIFSAFETVITTLRAVAAQCVTPQQDDAVMARMEQHGIDAS